MVEHLVPKQEHLQKVLALILQHGAAGVHSLFIHSQHVSHSSRCFDFNLLRDRLVRLLLLGFVIPSPACCILHVHWPARLEIGFPNQSVCSSGGLDHAAVVDDAGEEIGDVFLVHKDHLWHVEPVALARVVAHACIFKLDCQT